MVSERLYLWSITALDTVKRNSASDNDSRLAHLSLSEYEELVKAVELAPVEVLVGESEEISTSAAPLPIRYCAFSSALSIPVLY